MQRAIVRVLEADALVTDLVSLAVETAASSTAFKNLAKEGLLLDSFYAVTHPSEPNYIAAVGGDFFGCPDDSFCASPQLCFSHLSFLKFVKTTFPRTSRPSSTSSRRRIFHGRLVGIPISSLHPVIS